MTGARFPNMPFAIASSGSGLTKAAKKASSHQRCVDSVLHVALVASDAAQE